MIEFANTQPPSVISGGIISARLATRDIFSDYESYSVVGWDGDDADSIGQDALRSARFLNGMLPRGSLPDIAPGTSGTIDFEWRGQAHSQIRYLFISVGPGARVSVQSINQLGRPMTNVYNSVQSAWPEIVSLTQQL